MIGHGASRTGNLDTILKSEIRDSKSEIFNHKIHEAHERVSAIGHRLFPGRPTGTAGIRAGEFASFVHPPQ